MSNTCFTGISFNGVDAPKLKEDIERWADLSEDPDNKYWLGNFMIGAGLVSKEEADEGPGLPRYKGSITYLDLIDDEQLYIDTETAWGPMIKMWQMIVDKMNYDLEIIYHAEEPGNELYWTNDITEKGNYHVECNITALNSISDREFYCTDMGKEELNKLLLDILSVNQKKCSLLDTTEALIKKAQDIEYPDGDYFEAYPIKLVEIKDTF